MFTSQKIENIPGLVSQLLLLSLLFYDRATESREWDHGSVLMTGLIHYAGSKWVKPGWGTRLLEVLGLGGNCMYGVSVHFHDHCTPVKIC